METAKADDLASIASMLGDLLDGWQLCCTFDVHCCQRCASLSGRIFRANEPRPSPPLHDGCRCFLVPIIGGPLASLFPIGTRASSGVAPGQVPANWSYHEWLAKSQPHWFIAHAMGWYRAKLFRDGWLTPEQFAELQLTTDFKLRTLEEMRAVAPIHFLVAEIPVGAPDFDDDDDDDDDKEDDDESIVT